jgi:hypothetical protein
MTVLYMILKGPQKVVDPILKAVDWRFIYVGSQIQIVTRLVLVSETFFRPVLELGHIGTMLKGCAQV